MLLVMGTCFVASSDIAVNIGKLMSERHFRRVYSECLSRLGLDLHPNAFITAC